MGEVSPTIPAFPVKAPHGRPKWVNKFNWSDGSTELLIDLWQSKPILFDVKHPEYHKRDKKEKAISEIRKCMEDSGFNVDANDITFTSLRSYFSQERAKVTASKSGDGADAVIESRWKFFSRLMFLSDSITPRSIYSTLSNEPADKGKKRKTSASHLENVEKLMATAVHCLQTPGPSEMNTNRKIRG